MLVKNEADRYLRRVIERCAEFSDEIIVLDDRSTDDTPKIAKELGCVVRTRSVLQNPAWGDEAPARAELWDWMAATTKDGWGLVVDADMLLQGDPRDLCWTTEVNAWGFILYDLWDEQHFRYDGPWRAHQFARPWLLRPGATSSDYAPLWQRNGIHVGHIPANFPLTMGVAPPDTYYWLHLQYSSPESRARKYRAYKEVAHLMTDFEKAHAESILT